MITLACWSFCRRIQWWKLRLECIYRRILHLLNSSSMYNMTVHYILYTVYTIYYSVLYIYCIIHTVYTEYILYYSKWTDERYYVCCTYTVLYTKNKRIRVYGFYRLLKFQPFFMIGGVYLILKRCNYLTA